MVVWYLTYRGWQWWCTNIQDTRISGVQEDTDVNNKSDKYDRVKLFDNEEFKDTMEGLSRWGIDWWAYTKWSPTNRWLGMGGVYYG